MLLRVVPKREDGRLALALALALAPTFAGGASLSKSSSPAAANAFAVRGPSQSVIERGAGSCAGGMGDDIVTRLSMTLVLRFRVRRLPISRGRSMSKLGRFCCRRLGAVPMEDGGREEGDADSTSHPLV